MKTIKEQIKAYLEAGKIMPSHLARNAGISPSILSLFLSGKRGMTIDTWEKIQRAMK